MTISKDRVHYWYDIFFADWMDDDSFRKKYGVDRDMTMTEDEFIDNYDSIRSSIAKHIGWPNYIVSKNGRPESLYTEQEIDMRKFIPGIARYNYWLKPGNRSPRLKIFLKERFKREKQLLKQQGK
jgi:hypothetical protein